MYLIKIEMDRRSPSVQQALRDCEDMHRNVQKLFPGSRKDTGVLYALHASGQSLSLYALAMEEPKSGVSVNGMQVLMSKDMSAFERTFETGRILAFHLAAHPSKKVRKEGVKNSRRVFLSAAEQQAEWLQKKGIAGGFEILSMQIKNGCSLYSAKKEGLKLPFAEYTGYLKITDLTKFCKCWESGIGPEKAYGLGMLLVR